MKKGFLLMLTWLFIMPVAAGCSSEDDETTVMPPVEENEPTIKVPSDFVFQGIFDNTFNTDTWRNKWGVPWNNRAAESQIVPGGFGTDPSLRVSYPEGAVGPGEGGAQFPVVFNNMPGDIDPYYNELYISYNLKFEEGFDFKLGGKLPGIMGGGNSWSRSGGSQPDGTNGWTLRFMWRQEGRLVVYAYIPPSGNGKWGGIQWGQDIDCNFTAVPGKWHRIDQYVNIGTPGQDDGKLIVWIDGEEKLNIDDMRFWDIENDYGKIGGIYFSTFHGGNSPDWGPLHDSYMQFANFSAFKKFEKKQSD